MSQSVFDEMSKDDTGIDTTGTEDTGTERIIDDARVISDDSGISDDIELFDETPEQIERREAYNIKYEIPPSNIVHLGPKRPSCVKTFARIVRQMLRTKTPIPRSRFASYVSSRVTGEDKQDFSMIITGRKGSGKSYSSLRICQMIAKEHVTTLGGKPEDYFSIDNCCLLEDTEGINKIVKYSKKYQIILIDDAGVAIGSRDFATTNNKNFNKILSTCRTKRWVVLLNTPAKTHIDKQVRELVDCWASVFLPQHPWGFNIIKIHSISINEQKANHPYLKRYEFDKQKVDMWAVLMPDKATVTDYDIRREAAAQRLIDSMLTGDEAPKVGVREQHRQNMFTKYSDTILKMAQEGASERAMVKACPGLSNSMLMSMRAHLGV